MPSSTKWKVVPTALPGFPLPVRHDEDGRAERRFLVGLLAQTKRQGLAGAAAIWTG